MRVDGWMAERSEGCKERGPSVRHPSIRSATAIRMKNLPQGGSEGRGGREGEAHPMRDMYEATSLMSDRIHLQRGIIDIAEWMICQCMREYIYVLCGRGEGK